jgi:hypothetical protein
MENYEGLQLFHWFVRMTFKRICTLLDSEKCKSLYGKIYQEAKPILIFAK